MPDQSTPLTAPHLYALSEGVSPSGADRCYWCGTPCDRVWFKDAPPPQVGVKRTDGAKCPGNHYVCVGCWLFRRRSITVTHLDGTYRDRQCPLGHSWLITSVNARAVRLPQDGRELIQRLLDPPLRFCLSLLDGKAGHINRLHSAQVNDLPEVLADTPLLFTLNGIPLTYSVYELGEAMRNGSQGKSPGVGALVYLCGQHEDLAPAPVVLSTPKGGRPKDIDRPDGKVTKKPVKVSGSAA